MVKILELLVRIFTITTISRLRTLMEKVNNMPTERTPEG